ncbi:phenoloxidase-activating factor 3-like [Penaeus japonicus]|uniref:phenoloxidase-activating factor 3-like n=1 Tax=Penaeus japonicus TaxID=27405 RepID=UPI001C715CB3|nr:phenoloxidase-activating factor 3-like [Penaeus japonicus]
MHFRFPTLVRAIAAVALLGSVATGAAARERRQASCSAGTPCISIDSCPPVKALFLSPNSRDQRRAQQLVCGRQNRRLKVCCASSNVTPTPPPNTSTKPTTNPGGNGHLLPSNCGEVPSIDRIFGGEEAAVGAYPWMAALGYTAPGGNTLEWQCGGALINSRYVLTAAHCAHPDFLFGYTLKTVRLGEHDFSKNRDCSKSIDFCLPPVQDFTAEQVIIHPSFNKRAPESDDIALFRLNRNAQLNVGVHPICLPSAGLDVGSFLADRDAVVIGWGYTETDRNVQALQKVGLPFVDLRTCRSKHSGEALVDEQVCFGGRPGQDSCNGDSGGPLFLDAVPGTILGIVSKGGACGKAGIPAIYTNVASYRGWIEQNLSP